VQAVLENIAGDGLIYDRKKPSRPWNVGIGYGKKSWDEDYSCLAGDGRLLCGMDYYAQASGDETWLRQMKRTAERMLELAILRENDAYYPNVGCGSFSYRQSGWVHPRPAGAQEGAEGDRLCPASDQRPQIRWYVRRRRALWIFAVSSPISSPSRNFGGVVEKAAMAPRAHFGAIPRHAGWAAGDHRITRLRRCRLKSFVRDGTSGLASPVSRLGIDTALGLHHRRPGCMGIH
jgi:hypothetical protein